MTDVPNGFQPLHRSSPFTEVNGPFYVREENGSLTFGLRIAAKHCNSSGTVHGGLIATICDLALGGNIVFAATSSEARLAEVAGPLKKLVTISLSMDYAGHAAVGDWIEVRVEVQKIGKSLAFANAYVFRGAERIARSSAVFRSVFDAS